MFYTVYLVDTAKNVERLVAYDADWISGRYHWTQGDSSSQRFRKSLFNAPDAKKHETRVTPQDWYKSGIKDRYLLRVVDTEGMIVHNEAEVSALHVQSRSSPKNPLREALAWCRLAPSQTEGSGRVPSLSRMTMTGLAQVNGLMALLWSRM
jgi:hypothetical protein